MREQHVKEIEEIKKENELGVNFANNEIINTKKIAMNYNEK